MARNVKTVSYSLPAELVDKIEQRAAENQISKSSYLTMLLSQVVNKPLLLQIVESDGLRYRTTIEE